MKTTGERLGNGKIMIKEINENLKFEPSEEQQAIIDSKVNTLVVSKPGAGKTTTLALKVIDLLKNDIKPENILCITYTTKAKKEMFDTIYKMAKEQKISESIILKIHISTFHSMALDYLTNAGLISGDIVGNNLLRYSLLESFEKTLNIIFLASINVCL